MEAVTQFKGPETNSVAEAKDPQVAAFEAIVGHLNGIVKIVNGLVAEDRDEVLRLVQSRATRTLKALAPAKPQRKGRK